MTDQKVDLALAFLQSQPGSAAAVLEQQPVEHVASFLSDVPYTKAALVLRKMLPRYTAKLCKYLEPDVIAGFFSEMESNYVAAILRYSDIDTNKKVIELLPESTKLACNLMLSYSEDSVGAWMITNIATLPDDCDVKEAFSRLAMEEDFVAMDEIYVLDRDSHVQGTVNISSLLRAPSNLLIKAVMNCNPDTISGRSFLVTVSNDPMWTGREAVAVINRHHQMVGVLRHLDLRKGLDEISTTINKPDGSDPLTGVIEVYGNSLLALFNTVGDAASIKRS